MAVVKLLHIKEAKRGKKFAPLRRSLEYIFDVKNSEGKTDQGKWIGGNAGRTAAESFETMMETKRIFGKEDGRQGYHYIISFAKGETTPEDAFAMAQEFCECYFKDLYDYSVVLHTDREHLHAHIVFNSVGFDGYKYRYEKGDWEKEIIPVMNRICEKYGVSVMPLDDLEEKRKKRQTKTKEPNIDRKITWNVIIRDYFDQAIEQAQSMEEFFEILQEQGYLIRMGYSKKLESEYFTVRTEGMERARRNYSLGRDYTIQNIRYRIENRDFIREVRHNAIQHPVRDSLRSQLKKIYPVYHIRIQRSYLLRIGCAYRTYYRWVRPFPNAWKYKADLIRMQQLIERYNFLHGEYAKADRATKELQAEGCAFSICSRFGIDTGSYSFDYLASYSRSRELTELKATLGVIRDTSCEMIEGIETRLAEMRHEPEIRMAESIMEGRVMEPASESLNSVIGTEEVSEWERQALLCVDAGERSREPYGSQKDRQGR